MEIIKDGDKIICTDDDYAFRRINIGAETNAKIDEGGNLYAQIGDTIFSIERFALKK